MCAAINLGARHRLGYRKHLSGREASRLPIRTLFLYCFSADWEALRGYHNLMQLGPRVNVLAQHTAVLAKLVRQFGVRGLLQLLGETVAGPWLKLDRLGQVLRLPYQLRLD